MRSVGTPAGNMRVTSPGECASGSALGSLNTTHTHAQAVDVVLHANLHAVVRETPRVHFYACKASLTLQMELGQSA